MFASRWYNRRIRQTRLWEVGIPGLFFKICCYWMNLVLKIFKLLSSTGGSGNQKKASADTCGQAHVSHLLWQLRKMYVFKLEWQCYKLQQDLWKAKLTLHHLDNSCVIWAGAFPKGYFLRCSEKFNLKIVWTESILPETYKINSTEDQNTFKN